MTKACLILIVLLTSCNPATFDGPLYEDSTGWMMYSALVGYDIVGPYLSAKDRAMEMGIPSLDIPGYDYIKRDPVNIYGFSVIVPQEVRLLWTTETEVTIFYMQDGDTLSSTGVEFFFCEKYPTPVRTFPGKVISSNDMVGSFPLPNDRIYETPNGNPVVFVRFPFGKEPQALLSCTVANVQVIGGNS